MVVTVDYLGIFIHAAPPLEKSEKIKTDMNNLEIANIIQHNLADAKPLNVRKIPGFFVHRMPLTRFGYKQLHYLVGLPSPIRVEIKP